MQSSTISEYIMTSEGIRSVIKIQSLWRGYTVRRNFLSSDLYRAALEFIQSCPAMEGVPRANAGVTKVFLPNHLPVVFKNLGPVRSKNRFFTMWKARDICLRNDYKHLLIPRAHPTVEYNIEERFPVADIKLRHQIALYEENKESFSDAAKDFTGFLCRCVFPDILTVDHPYLQGDHIPLVRSDNIPFLIEGNVGKVALIDLGGLQVRSHELSLDEALDCAKTAIYVFPYHLTEICEVVSSFCPDIQSQVAMLELVCAKAMIQLKSVYADHRAFIEKHTRSNRGPTFCEEGRLDAKIHSLIEETLTNHPEALDKNLINPKEVTQICASLVKQIAEAILQLPHNPSLDIYSRAMRIDCEPFFKSLSDERDIIRAKQLMQLTLDELITRREIGYANFYFNRAKKQFLIIHY